MRISSTQRGSRKALLVQGEIIRSIINKVLGRGETTKGQNSLGNTFHPFRCFFRKREARVLFNLNPSWLKGKKLYIES